MGERKEGSAHLDGAVSPGVVGVEQEAGLVVLRVDHARHVLHVDHLGEREARERERHGRERGTGEREAGEREAGESEAGERETREKVGTNGERGI